MLPNLLLFFNIGGGEIVIIVLVIIIFFGSKKIPEIARTLGKGFSEIKNATNDIQQEIKNSVPDITKIKDSLNVQQQVTDFITKETAEATSKPAPQKETALPSTSEKPAEDIDNTIPTNAIPRN